ncbi:MAG: hypothetical protein Q7U82_11505, partial [Gammaproteobacteria bacterium]|nr:hypothetical protein [Gammaproteobacteria bacterium]
IAAIMARLLFAMKNPVMNQIVEVAPGTSNRRCRLVRRADAILAQAPEGDKPRPVKSACCLLLPRLKQNRATVS